MGVGMATTNLFGHPAFKDGAFTSNDRGVRRAAIGKAMRAIDLGARLGAEVFVFWGGREGTEAGAAKDPRDALERYREAIDVLSDYAVDAGLRRCASRSSPSPTSRAATSSCRPSATRCTSSPRSQRPDMVGVNPEVAHETMAGLSFHHGVGAGAVGGQAVPHRPQRPADRAATTRTSASARRTSRRPSSSCGCSSAPATTGPRHFDAHAYRNEDAEGVWDFARGLHAHLPRAGRARPRASTQLPEVREALAARVGAPSWASRRSAATTPTRSRPRSTGSTRWPRAATTTSGSTSSSSRSCSASR